MIVSKKFFHIAHYKKMLPVVLLSCVTLIGCSNSNIQSESPKQTKQEHISNQSFVKLEKRL